MAQISDLTQLLKSMDPVINPGVYYFVTVENALSIPIDKVISLIRENEGISLIVSEQTAKEYQLKPQLKMAWITLNVNSDLAAVGLTAAFSNALGQAGISCNVVAGNYHDHIFVPYAKADPALQTLRGLQQRATKEESI